MHSTQRPHSRSPHELLHGLAILVRRPPHHILGQRDALDILLALCNEPVADVLLVKRVLRAAGSVPLGGPVARRVGREHFVDEDELFGAGVGAGRGEEAEFELGVGKDDAARQGVLGRLGVEADGDRGDLRCEIGATDVLDWGVGARG